MKRLIKMPNGAVWERDFEDVDADFVRNGVEIGSDIGTIRYFLFETGMFTSLERWSMLNAIQSDRILDAVEHLSKPTCGCCD